MSTIALSTLTIDVCGVEYTITIALEPMTDGDGTPLMGQVDTLCKTITLSPELPPANRRRVLVHELAHAVDDEIGRAYGDESLADRAALIDGIMHDWPHTAELYVLRPDVSDADHGPMLCADEAGATRVDCPTCQRTYSGGSIVTDQLRKRGRCWLARQRWACETCRCLYTQTVEVDQDGEPTGAARGTMTRITAREDPETWADFMASHGWRYD